MLVEVSLSTSQVLRGRMRDKQAYRRSTTIYVTVLHNTAQVDIGKRKPKNKIQTTYFEEHQGEGRYSRRHTVFPNRKNPHVKESVNVGVWLDLDSYF